MNLYNDNIKKEDNIGSKSLIIDLSELKKDKNIGTDPNEIYSQELLIQNRFLNNIGIQKEFFITPDSEKYLDLENKFDYKDFIVKNPDFFLKKDYLQTNTISNIQNNNPAYNNEILSKPRNIFHKAIKYLVSRFPYTIIVTVLIYGVQLLNANYQHEKQSYYTVGITSNLIGQTKDLFKYSKNYSQASEQTLIKAKAVDYSLVSNNQLLNMYGGTYKIHPATTTNLNDTIAVDIDQIPSQECTKLVQDMQYLNVTQVKVNNTTILKNGFIDLVNVGKACSLKQNTVTVLENDNKIIK